MGRIGPRSRFVLGGLAIVFFAHAQALASSVSWTYQRVATSGTTPHVAAAMRTGDTWPTVFATQSTSGATLQAFSLTPAGWSGSALDGGAVPFYARARSGSDGRVGAAWYRSGAIRFAQSSKLGWQSLAVGSTTTSSPGGAPDVGYLSGDRPVVAYRGTTNVVVAAYDGLSWNADTIDAVFSPASPGSPISTGTGDRVAVAVDSQDRVAVAYNDGGKVTFALNDVANGTWIGSAAAMTPATSLSMAFGPHDETGIAIVNGSTLSYAYFDTQSGKWASDLLSTALASERVSLNFNNLGQPALAYVEGQLVHYRINDGNGWADIILPSGTDLDSGLIVTPTSNTDAALAFDRNNVPLIAYNTDSVLVLAYDPLVPEPAAALLLVVGLGWLSRRRCR